MVTLLRRYSHDHAGRGDRARGARTRPVDPRYAPLIVISAARHREDHGSVCTTSSARRGTAERIRSSIGSRGRGRGERLARLGAPASGTPRAPRPSGGSAAHAADGRSRRRRSAPRSPRRPQCLPLGASPPPRIAARRGSAPIEPRACAMIAAPPTWRRRAHPPAAGRPGASGAATPRCGRPRSGP